MGTFRDPPAKISEPKIEKEKKTDEWFVFFFTERVPAALSMSGFWLGFSILLARTRRLDTADEYVFEMSSLLTYKYIKGFKFDCQSAQNDSEPPVMAQKEE